MTTETKSTLPTEEKRFQDKPDFMHGDVAGQVEPGCGFINLDIENVLTVSEATSLRDWLNEVLP